MLSFLNFKLEKEKTKKNEVKINPKEESFLKHGREQFKILIKKELGIPVVFL